MSEDLQERFGRPTKRRVIYDCGAETVSVFPSEINIDAIPEYGDRARTWVVAFHEISKRETDFIPYDPNCVRKSEP